MCVRQDVRFVSESASSQLRGGGHRSLGLNATSTSMFDRFLQAFSIFCHNFARDPSQLTRLVVIGEGVDRSRTREGGGVRKQLPSEQTRRQCRRRCAVMRQPGAPDEIAFYKTGFTSTRSLQWNGMLQQP